ncbi:MAG TPA: thymidine kinase [Candidatus Baltobacteraceae bacterium]|jgi:thymidine kinase|nr:thymidine kinase [Candidatus Baltobacteraceae bacterium]
MAKLYFRYSAMNAGKSTALLQVAHNYEEHGRRVRIFTAAIDRRHGVGFITSRLGPKRQVETFDGKTDFFASLQAERGLGCVLVDEAQFLTPDQVRQLHRVAHMLDIPAICYGIRSDFLGEPFPGSAYLLTLADSLEELKNICACGKKATMNPRIDERGARVLVGAQIAIEGEVRYEPMCAKCFYAASSTEPGT